MGRWRNGTIGDACRVVNGGTPKTKVAEYWDGSHAWITPVEMGRRKSPYVCNTRRTLSEDGLAKCSASLLPSQSVILSSRAPIGHLVINEVPMATNQGCKGLVPNDELHYKFLYYYLYSIVDILNDLGSGTTFKELSATKLKGVPIPLPSLSEQERIVAILDEAFAAIATATANAEKNLANVRELFESELNRVFQNPDSADAGRDSGDAVMKGWQVKTLGDLYEITSSKRVFRSEWKRSGVPFYRAREIVKLSQQGFVDNELYISQEMYDQYSAKYGIPREGDIMVTGVGTLGVCYVVQKNDKFYFKDGNIIWLKNRGDANSQFVEYAFKSDLLRKQIDDSAGATVGTYTITKAKCTRIPLPSLPEQERIVARLDKLSAKKQSLVGIYEQKTDALALLKQSILHKAFTGELTGEPDKILTEAGL